MSKTDLFTLKESAEFESQHINKNITNSNISYLVNYNIVPKVGNNKIILIDKQELVKYYKNHYKSCELDWKNKLGSDSNRALSLERLKEAETDKHLNNTQTHYA